MQSIISIMYVLPNRSHGVVYNYMTPHKFADALRMRMRMRDQIDGAVIYPRTGGEQSVDV